MTASTPATPDPRADLVYRRIVLGRMVDEVEALDALASLAAELAATRQALAEIARPDDAIAANEDAFSVHAYRRCVSIARAVLAGEDTT